MYNQQTTYEKLLINIGNYLTDNIYGPWKIKAFSLLSLLIGFYISSSLTAYYLQKSGQRVFVVAFIVLIIEVLVRIKPSIDSKRTLFLIIVDNIRIGTTYAIVLEAFKLGS